MTALTADGDRERTFYGVEEMGMAGIPEMKRFFRSAAGVDMDKDDLKRFRVFIDEKVDDIAIAGRNAARRNGRDVIEPQDLPITKGLQERMREFDQLEDAAEIRELLRHTLRRPPDDVTFGEETEDVLGEVFGGISVAMARSFRIVDPRLTNPSSEHWDRAFELFRLLL